MKPDYVVVFTCMLITRDVMVAAFIMVYQMLLTELFVMC
jgi:hypothetical protein